MTVHAVAADGKGFNQRGFKYKYKYKPFGSRYLGVTRTTMSSRHSYLSDDHVRSASSKLPVAGISSVLQLNGHCLSSLLFDASVNKKNHGPHCPSHPAKVSKTPIRVNPLAYSICGK